MSPWNHRNTSLYITSTHTLSTTGTLAHGSLDKHSAAAASRWCRCLRNNEAARPLLAGLEQDTNSECYDCPVEEWTVSTCREPKKSQSHKKMKAWMSRISGEKVSSSEKENDTEREKRASWWMRRRVTRSVFRKENWEKGVKGQINSHVEQSGGREVPRWWMRWLHEWGQN